jgi:putative FmdB family regulatory protein
MPNYSYNCEHCNTDFELFFYIKDYVSQPKCINCSSKKTTRNYIADVVTQSSNVKKSDSELKTIGDLALRNSDRMSEDEKISLFKKHNAYKENIEDIKPLPQGMNRVKKQPKIKWPGSDNIRKKRSIKK